MLDDLSSDDLLLDASTMDGVERAVVAVSGGGDSIALLHLLHRRGIACTVVTVDHRLRGGSAADAAFVAAMCARLVVPHLVATRPHDADWGSQARARDGRYDALLTIARMRGSPVVTGHTMEDQAETLRMRARRGGGTLGLSGIAPVAKLDGDTRLLRPLLGARRETLRHWLRTRAIDWREDPSNAHRCYERVRTRDTRGAVGIATLDRFAAAARRHRGFAMRRIADDLAHGFDGVVYRPGIEGTLLLHAVRLLLAWRGGAAHLPGEDRVARFLGGERALTIAGAVVRRRGGALHFERDPRAPGRAGLPGRFRPAVDDPVHAALVGIRTAR